MSPPETLKVSKRQLKLSGQTYAEQTKRLEKSLSKQLEELKLVEGSLNITRAREQVLADLIATQEVTISLLEQQQQWLDALGAEDPAQGLQEAGTATVLGSDPSAAAVHCKASVQQVAVQHDASGECNLHHPQAAAVAAAPAVLEQQQAPEQPGYISYIAGLLAKATPQQLRQVLNMTADDWQQYKHDHFMRLVALLELVNRPSLYEECEGFEGQDAAMQDAIERQQQQQRQPEQSAGSGCAAPTGSGSGVGAGTGSSGVAAAGATTATAATDPSGLHSFEIPKRFTDAVDEGITLSFLALFFNHLTIMNASSNQDLPQQVAPPGLWLRVVKKLNLTQQQLLHLRLASEEFTRLNRSSAAQGEALMDRASCPSLLLAAESSIQAAASTYNTSSSSAAGGSAGSTVTPSGERVGGSAVEPAAAAAGATAAAAAVPAAAAVEQPVQIAAAAATEAEADVCDGECDDEEQEGQLDVLLQRHLRLRFLYMVMIGMFVFNTLTRVQIAQMTVGCYPYYPMLTAVAEAAAVIHKQQEEEHKKRIKTRRRKQQLELEEEDEQQQPYDDSDSSEYSRQQLRVHQKQRSELLRLQQQFWQQQVEMHQKLRQLSGQQQ